jgi:hypothetical protein
MSYVCIVDTGASFSFSLPLEVVKSNAGVPWLALRLVDVTEVDVGFVKVWVSVATGAKEDAEGYSRHCWDCAESAIYSYD